MVASVLAVPYTLLSNVALEPRRFPWQKAIIPNKNYNTRDGMITNDGAKSDEIRIDGTGNGNDVTRNNIIPKDDWRGKLYE